MFAEYRIDEQLSKAMERKVWLPSGGSLVIDRTEAMTVVDVNTGKFTGQGGNLEETVTRNNLEAAEEIVRQLRLRDVGGIIVIDFIDMVLESNRELVLRRLLECLARDRTKHQVAEVTSLGLVQMTRKRVGAGLLEAFSEPCECCNGRGVHVSLDLADIGSSGSDSSGNSGQSNGHGRGRRGSESKSDDTRSSGNGSNGGASNGGASNGGASGNASNGNGNGGANGEDSKPGEGRRSRNRRRGNRQDAVPSPAALSGTSGPAGDSADGAVATADPVTTDAPETEDTAGLPEPAHADVTSAAEPPRPPRPPSAPAASDLSPAPSTPESSAFPAAPMPASVSKPAADPSTPEASSAPEGTTVGVGPDLEATEVPAPGADPATPDSEPPTEGH